MDVEFGPYRLKRQEQLLLGPDGPVQLSGRLFAILTALVDRPNHLIGKAELFDIVWPGLVVEENTLQVHISALRKMLDPSMIVTVHGRGYKYGGPQPVPVAPIPVSRVPVAQSSGETILPSKPVVIVVPFENQSGNPEQQYFSDGITQDISDRLTRFRLLSVIGQHSASALRGSLLDFAGIREKFKADFVVTGSVRRVGDRVRIAVRLTDARNATAAWAERYDCAALEIFAMQDDVVSAIVNTIEGRIIATSAASVRSKPTSSWSAYDCLLQGRELCNNGREPDSIFHFTRAVAIDPDFVLGNAWLSLAQVVTYENTADPDLLKSAEAAAQKAVLLDHNEPVAHWAAAMAAMYASRHADAGRHFERAMELNPADIQIRADRAQWLRCVGHLDEALVAVDEALQHGPFAPSWFWSMRGEILFDLKRYSEAQLALDNIPEKKSRAWFFLAATQALMGERAKATETGQALMRQWPAARLSCLPFINPSAYEDSKVRLLQGLREAGLPE